MKILIDLLNNDFFDLFDNDKNIGSIESINIDKEKLSKQQQKTLALIKTIQAIKNHDLNKENILGIFSEKLKEFSNEKILLNEIKDFLETTQNWIYSNISLPYSKAECYQAIFKEITEQNENKEQYKIIDFLILTYPVEVLKVITYNKEKNKQEFFLNHHLLNEVIENNINSPKKIFDKNIEKKEENKQKELKEIVKEIDKNELNKENDEQEEKYKQKYIHFVTSFLEKINENDLIDIGAKNYYQTIFKSKIREVHNKLKLIKYSDEDILKKFVIPLFIEMEQKNINQEKQSLFNLKEEEKFLLNEELINGGEFWKIIRNIPENIKNNVVEKLTNIIKFNTYNNEEKFKLSFETLSFITSDKELFKERIDFLEKIGLDVNNSQVYCYAYKEENKNKYKISVVNEEEIKNNPNLKNKEQYKRRTMIEILNECNIDMWKEVLKERIENDNNIKLNRRMNFF